jgi:hypothetical protein
VTSTSPGARFIKDILIPLAGVVLVFVLVFRRGDPGLYVLAGTMMGFPLAALADRHRTKEQGEKDG